MDIKRNGAQPSQKAPAEHFSGTVRIAPLFQSSAPGARRRRVRDLRTLRAQRLAYTSARKTRMVTFGSGLHQRWRGPIEERRPGYVVTVGPNVKHWHGAFLPLRQGSCRLRCSDGISSFRIDSNKIPA